MSTDSNNDPQTQAGVQQQWPCIKPGDRITIRTPHGSERTGRVVMWFATHCVLNGGGRHGMPLVATPANFLRHVPARTQGLLTP